MKTYRDAAFASEPELMRRRQADANLKHVFGITLAQYTEMLARQRGACAICGATSPGPRNARFAVDHDHATGKVRGLLCSPCNLAIGMFRDDADLIDQAAAYLDAGAA